MRSEWPLKTLNEVGVVLIDCVHKTPPAAEEGYPYIAIPQMKEGCIDFDASPRLISEKDLAEWTKKAAPQKDDIILSRRCNPGETAYVDGSRKFALGQNLVLLRPVSDEIFPPFLRWMVRSPCWWEQVGKYLNVGAVFDSLKCADIPRFELPVPPVNSQKTIAHILGTLDDKIELNRQMNTTLESMAKALFKSWFVDFDPVIDNALAAGNDIPDALQAKAAKRKALGANRKPLPEGLKQQFPDRFVFTEEMGWVPEGWEVLALDEIAHYQNGLALQKFRPEDPEHFLPVVKIAQLRSGVADSEEKASPDIKPECIIDDGDVVFSWSGTLLVDIWCGGKAALNQHLFKVTSEKYPRWFYYWFTQLHLGEFKRIAADKAVTMGHIKREHLSRAYCSIPDGHLIKEATYYFDSLMDRAIGTRLECKSLASARDTLLPKLLSGEVRIPDAEKQLAEAL